MAQGTAGAVMAHLALGSNLGDPEAHLSSALRAIGLISGTTVVQKSSLYRSPAWGTASAQPDYLNAVVAVMTNLTPNELWNATCRIEQAQGRARDGERNAARTLDIDLLLYGDLALHDEKLTLPHPRMHERAFVLRPLLEIAPHIAIPGQVDAAILLKRLENQVATRWKDSSAWS